MHQSRILATSLVAVFCLTGLANAQDAKKPPATEFSGDLGLVNATGNTSFTAFNVNERFIRRLPAWMFTQDFGTVYGTTDGKESSNLSRASVRADVPLGSHWALYGRTGFDRNKFAGIKSRFGEGVGAVAKLVTTAADQLAAEAGFELTQQTDLADKSDSFSSLRGAASWKHALTASSSFYQAVEVLPNLQDSKDLRVNSETALTAPLSTHVSMKLSYLVRFDNLPALNAAGTAPLRKSDRILSTGIQISY